MPIYEYYCPNNHTIYQFYAKTLAQGQTTPKCPDDPSFPMQRVLSSFAIQRRGGKSEAGSTGSGEVDTPGGAAEDARMEAAMSAMEQEFSQADENDPRAMARMMRRMSELTGEKIDGPMEEVVRKLEEGADPDSLEDQFGAEGEGPEAGMNDPLGEGLSAQEKLAESGPEKKHRFRSLRREPRRDPKLYDYE